MKKSFPTLALAVRRALRPAWAPTLRELLPTVERKYGGIVGRQRLYTTLAGMEQKGEVGIVGRADNRRYVSLAHG
jgi:hypothetical protein